jgi:hypothetical protein
MKRASPTGKSKKGDYSIDMNPISGMKGESSCKIASYLAMTDMCDMR